MARPEVRDYLYGRIEDLLSNNHIEYVKWDMNRSIADAYSASAPEDRQGEVLHRYILGLYELMDRITTNFPDVLIEGCSGGGARFDAGILSYSPQIWCSDDTDPIKRLSIQYGTSFGYPVSTMGAHVSASPNHQTGRDTTIHTRGIVAMSGTFGYELDPSKLSDQDKEEIKEQIVQFKKHYDLIQNGLYYRLTEIKKDYYEAWEFAAEDGSEALLNVVATDVQPNPALMHIRLKGLEPGAVYEIDDSDLKKYTEGCPPYLLADSVEVKRLTGDALMNAGYTLPWAFGTYPAFQMHFKKVK